MYKMRYSCTSCFFYENALTVAHLPTKHQCTDASSSQIFSPQWSKYSYPNLIIQYSLLCSIVIDDSAFMFINDLKRYLFVVHDQCYILLWKFFHPMRRHLKAFPASKCCQFCGNVSSSHLKEMLMVKGLATRPWCCSIEREDLVVCWLVISIFLSICLSVRTSNVHPSIDWRN